MAAWHDLRLHPESDSTALIAVGMLSAALFSSTFVLNYAMSLAGGHWVWSAILRYGFTILLIIAWTGWRRGGGDILRIVALFVRHAWFWTIAGTLACGVFYAGICFAADHLRGWMVAATFQLTVIASPIVLWLFGYRFPKRGFLFSALVFLGVALVNLDKPPFELRAGELALGIVPLLLSAFAYPAGNQLLNAAKNGTMRRVPHIEDDLLASPSIGVLLLSLGSIPFWAGLVAFTAPPLPAPHQWLHAFLIALLAGVMATSVFFYARNMTRDAYKTAAVDATQSTEVLFVLIFELLLLDPRLPTAAQALGLALVTLGLVGYGWRVNRRRPAPAAATD